MYIAPLAEVRGSVFFGDLKDFKMALDELPLDMQR